MNKKELVLLLIIILALIGLFSKSVYFDEVSNLDGQDKIFKEDVYKAIEQKYSSKIIKYRLIDINKEINEEDSKVIYTGKIRKYLLNIIPFSQMKIKIEYEL